MKISKKRRSWGNQGMTLRYLSKKVNRCQQYVICASNISLTYTRNSVFMDHGFHPPLTFLPSLLCSSHPWFLVWHMFAWTMLDKHFPGIAIEWIRVSGIKAEVICTTSWKSPWKPGELVLSPFLRYASGTAAVKAGAVLGHRMEAVLRM